MYTKAIYLLCWFFSHSLPVRRSCSLLLALALVWSLTQFEHKNYARFWCWWFKTSFLPINFKPHFRHFFIVMNTLDRFIFFLPFSPLLACSLNILRLYFSLPENIVLFFKLNFCFCTNCVIHFCESIQEVHRKWPFISCKRILHNYYPCTKCTLNLIFTLVLLFWIRPELWDHCKYVFAIT